LIEKGDPLEETIQKKFLVDVAKYQVDFLKLVCSKYEKSPYVSKEKI